MINLVVAGMVAVAAAGTPGSPVDLLASMDLWERDGGGAESFRLTDGQLQARFTRTEPATLLTRADYENFDLSFECRIDEWGEAGLFLHAPRNGAYRAGLEFKLANFYGGGVSEISSCSIFRQVAPECAPMKKTGQWNAIHVRMDWPRLLIEVNGQQVHDLNLAEHPELRYTLRRGAIGFQNIGWGFDVRGLKITCLADSEKAIAMYNGKDLTGWTVDAGRVQWQVRDGCIHGADGDGYLKHELVCEDFDLRMYIRTSSAANGGVYFRWLAIDPFRDRGHEIQILDMPGAIMATGSIYGICRGNDLTLTPGQWELLQLFVRGKHAVTYLNGVKCAETDALKHVRPGHICLQMHRGNASIDFKEIYIRPVK